MMCASASLAVEMWLMFVTRPRFLNVVRMESLNESVLCARNVDHALCIWSSPSNAGAHSAMRNGLRLSTVPA